MAPSFEPPDPDFERRVRDSFQRQGIMGLIGARLSLVAPGHVEIELPFRDDLTQQHGFFHAGATSTVADSAGGYAAFSLFPREASVLTVEYKINLVAPAEGELLRAVGRVLRPGRTLTLCDLEVFAVAPGGAKLCAKGLQTIMRLDGRSDMPLPG
ncbi:MAG: PaaI family thioesterase [Kiloniellales bacterium]|nr:PaaI family thioesterase [Kiloniellales bacterium]